MQMYDHVKIISPRERERESENNKIYLTPKYFYIPLWIGSICIKICDFVLSHSRNWWIPCLSCVSALAR